MPPKGLEFYEAGYESAEIALPDFPGVNDFTKNWNLDRCLIIFNEPLGKAGIGAGMENGFCLCRVRIRGGNMPWIILIS